MIIIISSPPRVRVGIRSDELNYLGHYICHFYFKQRSLNIHTNIVIEPQIFILSQILLLTALLESIYHLHNSKDDNAKFL